MIKLLQERKDLPQAKIEELMRLEREKVNDTIHLKVGVEASDCWAGVERLNLVATDEYKCLAEGCKVKIMKMVTEAGPSFGAL